MTLRSKGQRSNPNPNPNRVTVSFKGKTAYIRPAWVCMSIRLHIALINSNSTRLANMHAALEYSSSISIAYCSSSSSSS